MAVAWAPPRRVHQEPNHSVRKGASLINPVAVVTEFCCHGVGPTADDHGLSNSIAITDSHPAKIRRPVKREARFRGSNISDSPKKSSYMPISASYRKRPFTRTAGLHDRLISVRSIDSVDKDNIYT